MLRPSATATHIEKIFATVEDVTNPSPVVSSWRRCIKIHGLAPTESAQPHRVDFAKLLHARQRSEGMIRAANETIDNLISLLGGADYMVFVTDAEAVALETYTTRTGDFWNRPQEEWVGTDFSERNNGTNGVGTVLREGRPMTIAADQHFQMRYTSVICSGAPIYGLDGAISGCLDITSSAGRNDPLANSLMLASAVDAARRIEARMLSDAHPMGKLVMASQTGMHPGALLAVDQKGGVVGATKSARVLLNLQRHQLTGTLSVEQLWANEIEDLSWMTAERRAIEMALTTAKSNTSAAARALGMSRSTLYRKIREYKLGTKSKGLTNYDRPNS